MILPSLSLHNQIPTGTPFSINPITAFQNQLNTLTDTDYYSYLRYRKYIQTIIDKKIVLILEDTWNKVTVNKKKYIEYIEKFKL